MVTVGAPGAAANVAVTALGAMTVMAHAHVPLHPPPLQPVNVDPTAGVAASVSTVPLAYVAPHVVRQLIPAVALVTVPLLVPDLLTINVYPSPSNVGVIVVFAVCVTVLAP